MEALKLRGSLTNSMAPMFNDAVGNDVARIWLPFIGRGGGQMMFEPNVKQVTYTIRRGNRRTGELITRGAVANYLLGSNQKNIDMSSRTEVARSTPLSMEQWAITTDKLNDSVPGEPTDNSGYTRQYRLRYYAAEAQNDMIKAQIRLMNGLAGQGIRTGYQTIITGNTDELYDFYRNPLNIRTLGTPWGSNPSSATPLKDLDTAISHVIAVSGRIPRLGFFGNTAWSAFLQTDEVANFRQETNSDAFVILSDKATMPSEYQYLVDAGWECKGFIRTWEAREIWVFTSEALADDASGNPQRAMPSTEVVLGSADTRCDAIFGPPETLPETPTDERLYQEWFGFSSRGVPPGQANAASGFIRPEMFYLDAYRNTTKTAYMMRSQTAPLFVPVDTDAWFTYSNAGS